MWCVYVAVVVGVCWATQASKDDNCLGLAVEIPSLYVVLFSNYDVLVYTCIDYAQMFSKFIFLSCS